MYSLFKLYNTWRRKLNKRRRSEGRGRGGGEREITSATIIGSLNRGTSPDRKIENEKRTRSNRKNWKILLAMAHSQHFYNLLFWMHQAPCIMCVCECVQVKRLVCYECDANLSICSALTLQTRIIANKSHTVVCTLHRCRRNTLCVCMCVCVFFVRWCQTKKPQP